MSGNLTDLIWTFNSKYIAIPRTYGRAVVIGSTWRIINYPKTHKTHADIQSQNKSIITQNGNVCWGSNHQFDGFVYNENRVSTVWNNLSL